MSINGKVALITGAGQGIGRAITLRLVHDDADMAAGDVKEGKMQGVADEVRSVLYVFGGCQVCSALSNR
jgi:meso-butanediol dehydrogenase / (S,S)-butanediol dehydrogenase / diacetyl reductase